jgi:hypothetical protein
MPKGIYKHSSPLEETRKNISLSMKGKKPWNTGKGKKVFCLDCGKDVALYSKRCCSCQRKFKPVNYWLGKKRYEETIEKIRLTKIEQHIVPLNAFKKGKEHPNYIDGRASFVSPHRYGDDWDKIRYLVYFRDGFQCQDCKKFGTNFDIHHIIPFLQSLDNSLNNLITLCKSCHMKAEQKLKKEIVYV